MRLRKLIASGLAASLLAVGFLSTAPVVKEASAESGGGSYEKRKRVRAPQIFLPVGPSYTSYDYPYYYARGHYPRHIVRYVYYGPNSWRPPYSRYSKRCTSSRKECVAGWSKRSRVSVRRRAR